MIETIVISKVVEPCVKNFIAPKIDSFAKLCKDAYNDYMIPQREHFKEYLLRTYEKYSVINTLALKNQQNLLKDLYIPLTIVRQDNDCKCHFSQLIDKYPVELVKEYNKILITDTAGMGKSTLTKYLFLDVVENGYGIPIYIELRRLSKNRNILQEIYNQLNSLSNEFDSDLLLRFIQTGDFVFFLDGYDEIPLEDRMFVTANVQEFISKAGKNIFFITSRPEVSLASFGEFQGFSIKQLLNVEAYELLRKLDCNGETSDRLISQLKSGFENTIRDFLKNPLLVSLLYTAYDYKQIIPLKKHIFYRQVYDAYFDSHDLSKGDSFVHDKYSKLDIDDFNKVLRFIAYRCLQLQKIEFEKDNLLGIIYEAREEYPELQFSPSDFLNDIIITVPLFCIDGCYYRWVHKSLQEYFAALFIYQDAKNQQDLILSTLYNSINLEKYINLLDLYSDIDYLGFRKNVVFPFCKDYIEFYNKNYFESGFLENEDIDYRISFLFLCEVYVYYDIHNIKTFTEIFEKSNQFTNEIKEISIKKIQLEDKSTLWLVCNIDTKNSILPLLLKHHSYLFNKYENIIHGEVHIDKECILKPNLGADNLDKFIFYNKLIKDYSIICTNYIDYHSCLDLIEQVTAANNENKLDLINGL